MGPPELQEAGAAFNAMAERMLRLLATERELVADLSHRLRTPLTVLHLAAEQVASPADAHRISTAVGQLETELNAVIETARAPLGVKGPDAPPGAERPSGGRAGGPARAQSALARVTADRARFWAVLAHQQRREFELSVTSEPTDVALGEDDLVAVIDALAGNVFRHTAPGTAFAVRLERSAQAVILTVEDAGPGIRSPESAAVRGASDGSTGLGLDIARRAAEATGGSLGLARGPLGGAQVRVTFGLADVPSRGARVRRRRSGRGPGPVRR